MRLLPAIAALTLPLWLCGSRALALADRLPANENLVIEGIPGIPLTLVNTVKRYTEFRGASLSSWHPTRREMLISTRFCNIPQVHRVTQPGGDRKQITFLAEAPTGATYQPTQGDYFVFSQDRGGNEFSQNYRFDLKTGEMSLLTDGQSKNSRGIWSRRGDRMAYTSTRRTGKDTDIYILDPRNPTTNRLVLPVEGGGWHPIDWSPDDQRLLVIEYLSANESNLWLLEIETGQKTLLTPKLGQEPIAYGGAVFSQDGQGLYLISDRGSEFQQLAYLDLATKTYTPLSQQIPWDVESFELSPNGQRLAFITNEAGMSVLHVLDTAKWQEVALPKLPSGLIFSLSWHNNSRDLGFSFNSAKTPTDVYSIDVTTGRLDRWTESETNGLDPSTFADAELVKWRSFDGREISGFLYRPPAKFVGPRPVMIDIHGGPEAQSRPNFLGRYNYFLNELGVAILFPNVRGSDGYGKTFLTLDNGFKREDSVRDIGALLDWMQGQKTLDASRVVVMGGSYGGYMALATATNYSDRIRGAINVVGISNFVTFLERTEGYRRDLRRVEYGDERDAKMREFLLSISPLNQANQIKQPLFVVHGKNDPRVPLNEAEQIVATVRKTGTPVWYLMATNEGHGFARKENYDFQFYATVLFVQEFLLK